MMFRAMLRAQWIWSRAIMWFFLAAAFSLPVLTVPSAKTTPSSAAMMQWGFEIAPNRVGVQGVW